MLRLIPFLFCSFALAVGACSADASEIANEELSSRKSVNPWIEALDAKDMVSPRECLERAIRHVVDNSAPDRLMFPDVPLDILNMVSYLTRNGSGTMGNKNRVVLELQRLIADSSASLLAKSDAEAGTEELPVESLSAVCATGTISSYLLMSVTGDAQSIELTIDFLEALVQGAASRQMAISDGDDLAVLISNFSNFIGHVVVLSSMQRGRLSEILTK